MDNLGRQYYYNSYFKNDVWPYACLAVGMTSPEMFNSIFKAFSSMLRVSKLVSLKWWPHFVFEKNKNGFPPSTHNNRGFTFGQPSSILWKSQFSQRESGLLATELNSF